MDEELSEFLAAVGEFASDIPEDRIDDYQFSVVSILGQKNWLDQVQVKEA